MFYNINNKYHKINVLIVNHINNDIINIEEKKEKKRSYSI